MITIPELETEHNVVNWLAQVLEQRGWGVETEVSCEDGSARADLIVENDGVDPIGIEVKHLGNQTTAQASVGAIQQIERYRGRQFGNAEVEQWAVFLYAGRDQFDGPPHENRGRRRLLKNMFIKMNIGYVEPYHYGSMKITFKNFGRYHIPLTNNESRGQTGGDAASTGSDKGDGTSHADTDTEDGEIPEAYR